MSHQPKVLTGDAAILKWAERYADACHGIKLAQARIFKTGACTRLRDDEFKPKESCRAIQCERTWPCGEPKYSRKVEDRAEWCAPCEEVQDAWEARREARKKRGIALRMLSSSVARKQKGAHDQ